MAVLESALRDTEDKPVFPDVLHSVRVMCSVCGLHSVRVMHSVPGLHSVHVRVLHSVRVMYWPSSKVGIAPGLNVWFRSATSCSP